MGNCSTTPQRDNGPAAAAVLANHHVQEKEEDEATYLDVDPPFPMLDETILGLTGPELHQSDLYKDLITTYEQKKRSTGDHERTMGDRDVRDKVEDLVWDLEKKRGFGQKAAALQDRMLADMGDRNPEKTLPEMHKQEWAQRKLDFRLRAVREAVYRIISEDLRTADISEEGMSDEA